MVKLKSNQKAPHFRLLDQNGHEVDFDDFKGHNLLIYFIPEAGKPECVTQECVVRDRLDELNRLDIQVIGICPDPPDENRRLDLDQELGFPILSDPTHSIASAYGAWTHEKLGHNRGGTHAEGVVRSAFLVNTKGEITDSWYDVGPKEVVNEALQYLR